MRSQEDNLPDLPRIHPEFGPLASFVAYRAMPATDGGDRVPTPFAAAVTRLPHNGRIEEGRRRVSGGAGRCWREPFLTFMFIIFIIMA